MNSELMVMTFPRQHKADTVLAAIRAMRKSPILCLGSVVVATQDRTGELTLRPGQEPAAAQEDRDTQTLLTLAELILRAPAPEAIDALTDRGIDGRFLSEIATSMEGESSALFVLTREDGVHDAGETRSALALFRGRIYQTSLSPQAEAYLSERWASNLARKGDRMSSTSPQEAKQIAEEAYIYAFPMLMGYRFAFASFLMPGLPSYRGPVNTLHGKAATFDHTFKDVITPNADTPYSLALLDLRAEPVVLQVPAITDRYYVFQFVDLFGTNPHFIGSRATGSKAGTYLAVGPGWEAEARDEFDAVLPFDTNLAFVIGRTQLLGAEDVPALAKVMASYKLQTLSAFRGQTSPIPPAVQWPIWNDEASRDERFIGTLNFLLTFCQPIHPSEADLMARFAQIGIGPGRPVAADALEAEVRDALRAGIDAARKTVVAKITTITKQVNGWTFSDIFGTREWYGGNFSMRAVAAMAGWGGNDVIEAIYPTARADADGNPLDGTQRYQIKFTTPPPAKAFWSVTMYDTTYDGAAGYLVENPINRYLINSTTPGLVYGEDGSLTVTIQRAQPQDTAERANWLPAPEGPFYLVMRIYWPETAALDGTWTPPSVRRTG